MTKDQQLKTLKSPKASKEQLREALAAALGVANERPGKENVKSIFSQCRDTFLEAYKKHTGFDYSFGAKDGKALVSIISKIGNLESSLDDVMKLDSFNVLICNLPDWYKQNAFSLTVINNKFNEIVASIKNNGGQTGITKDFGSRVAERIRARNAGS